MPISSFSVLQKKERKEKTKTESTGLYRNWYRGKSIATAAFFFFYFFGGKKILFSFVCAHIYICIEKHTLAFVFFPLHRILSLTRYIF